LRYFKPGIHNLVLSTLWIGGIEVEASRFVKGPLHFSSAKKQQKKSEVYLRALQGLVTQSYLKYLFYLSINQESMVPPKQQQERKPKQFSARSHSRSASYGRNLNKLGRITSSEQINHRPTLNRSKSTDGTLGRKNRSFTKLTGLHPLSRTRSHQPALRGGKVVLELHKEQDSSDDENVDVDKKSDEKSDHEEEEEEEEEEVDEFSDDEPQTQQQNQPPSQVQLSYKAPPQFSHASVPKNSSFSSEPTESQSQQNPPQLQPQISTSQDKIENSIKLDPTRLETEASKLNLNDPSDKIDNVNNDSSKQAKQQSISQYKENLSQYYQNMILSQSTGLVRDFGDQPFMNSLVQDQMNQGNNQNSLQYIHSNDHISGSIGNLRSTSSSSNSLRQFTMQNQANNHVPSNESSSMLSFRTKEPTGIMMTPAAVNNRTPRESAAGTPNNFNQFLKMSNSNIETRTQQKLWLQRENSLLDLPSASGNNANNPQLRRDFERVSREFVNVRRFSNPCVESIKRVGSLRVPKTSNGNVNGSGNGNGNAPMNLSNTKYIKNVQSNDFQAKLFKLWIDGESTGNRRSNQSNIGFNQPTQQQYLPSQRLPPLQTSNSLYNVNNSLRSPAAPTTRAVDRANNSPENKRIDLAAIRLPEEHVQKLS